MSRYLRSVLAGVLLFVSGGLAIVLACLASVIGLLIGFLGLLEITEDNSVVLKLWMN